MSAQALLRILHQLLTSEGLRKSPWLVVWRIPSIVNLLDLCVFLSLSLSLALSGFLSCLVPPTPVLVICVVDVSSFGGAEQGQYKPGTKSSTPAWSMQSRKAWETPSSQDDLPGKCRIHDEGVLVPAVGLQCH